VVAHLVQILGIELLIVGEKVESECGNLADISVSYLHYILLALVEFSTAALQVRSRLLDHPSQLL
jgi:hypothetical protein